jgi:hypothetical protein
MDETHFKGILLVDDDVRGQEHSSSTNSFDYPVIEVRNIAPGMKVPEPPPPVRLRHQEVEYRGAKLGVWAPQDWTAEQIYAALDRHYAG